MGPGLLRAAQGPRAQAGTRGVVVELVLFCTMYDDRVWDASPMNARNNVNGGGNVGKYEVSAGKDKGLLAVQRAVTRKLVAELKDFDNVYFEVCNEPYDRGGLTREWTDTVVAEAEAGLHAKHLIAQNVGHGGARAEGLNKHVSVVNFHAATPAVRLNYGLNRVIGNDETGGSDRTDRKYRTEGGVPTGRRGRVRPPGLLVHDRPPGRDGPCPCRRASRASGRNRGGSCGCSRSSSRGFDFGRMAPADRVVTGNPVRAPLEGTPRAARVTVQALAEAGNAYAVYRAPFVVPDQV